MANIAKFSPHPERGAWSCPHVAPLADGDQHPEGLEDLLASMVADGNLEDAPRRLASYREDVVNQRNARLVRSGGSRPPLGLRGATGNARSQF